MLYFDVEFYLEQIDGLDLSRFILDILQFYHYSGFDPSSGLRQASVVVVVRGEDVGGFQE